MCTVFISNNIIILFCFYSVLFYSVFLFLYFYYVDYLLFICLFAFSSVLCRPAGNVKLHVSMCAVFVRRGVRWAPFLTRLLWSRREGARVRWSVLCVYLRGWQKPVAFVTGVVFFCWAFGSANEGTESRGLVVFSKLVVRYKGGAVSEGNRGC
jgi:hypothetical protein